MSRASEYAHDVSSLYAQIGEARAREAANKGQIWGGALANIGDFVAQYPQRKAQMAEMADRAEQTKLAREQAQRQAKKEQDEAEADAKLRDLFASGQPPSISQIITAVGPERGVRIATGLKALQATATVDPREDFEKTQKVMRDVILGMNALPEPMRAEAYPGIRTHLVQRGVIKPEDAPETYDPAWWQSTMNYGKEPPKDATPADFTLSPGQVRFGPEGKPIANVPAPEKPVGGESGFTLSPGQIRYGPDGKPIASAPKPVGEKAPGRPVTSGDANKLAEFANSLNDVKVLTGELSGASVTGPAAAAGAALPNFVTAWTGIGATAKAKQAVIDRVKQVIGKALEGGVLRKEDEVKYQKILPTIGDPPSVAAVKLAGLKAAIEARQQAQIDALTDAGYDVSRFVSRQAAPTAPPPAAKKTNPFRK